MVIVSVTNNPAVPVSVILCYIMIRTISAFHSLPQGMPSRPSISVPSIANTAPLRSCTIEESRSIQLQQPTPPESNKRRKGNEGAWLAWANKSLATTPIGQLQPNILRKIPAIMECHAKRRSTAAALQNEQLLRRVIEEDRAGNLHAKVSVRMCNAVMDSWAKSNGGQVAAEKAERILKWMDRMYVKGENTSLRPTVVSYSSVIAAWSKSRAEGAAKRAQEILELMLLMSAMGHEDVAPNIVTHNAVLDCVAKSGKAGAGQEVEDMIREMEERYQYGKSNVKPNYQSYQSAIYAWSNEGKPRHAERVLAQLENSYAVDRDPEKKPNVHCFTACMDSWSKSSEDNKAQKAYEIFQRMEELYNTTGDEDLKPNIVAATVVLNACAYTNGNPQENEGAFAIAQRIMENHCSLKYGTPNHVTYAVFLEACGRLLPMGCKRSEIIDDTFRQCCEEGQVGEIVLSKYMQFASPRSMRHVLGYDVDEVNKHDISCLYRTLPSEWKRNVRGEKKATVQRKFLGSIQ